MDFSIALQKSLDPLPFTMDTFGFARYHRPSLLFLVSSSEISLSGVMLLPFGLVPCTFLGFALC